MILLLRTLWSALDRIVPPTPVDVERSAVSFVVGPTGVVVAPVPVVRREPCPSCSLWRDRLDGANDYVERLCRLLREHGIRAEVFADEKATL